jgi:hypothetical protein
MSEFNWSAYRSWSDRQERANEPHNEDCVCPSCHESHVDNGLVKELAATGEYSCCESELSGIGKEAL